VNGAHVTAGVGACWCFHLPSVLSLVSCHQRQLVCLQTGPCFGLSPLPRGSQCDSVTCIEERSLRRAFLVCDSCKFVCYDLRTTLKMDTYTSAWIFFHFFMSLVLKSESRQCSMTVEGKSQPYYCRGSEYCCNFGCCLPPSFQFYQLWYYWLMVIFMFLVCSGGQWWYKYWVQARYNPEIVTTMTGRVPSRRSNPRPARVSYHPARETVMLQHIWKPTYPGGARCSPPPSYHVMGVAGSSRELFDDRGAPKPSPYMQLYGPPPSYESVVANTSAAQMVVELPGGSGSISTQTDASPDTLEPSPPLTLHSSGTTQEMSIQTNPEVEVPSATVVILPPESTVTPPVTLSVVQVQGNAHDKDQKADAPTV